MSDSTNTVPEIGNKQDEPKTEDKQKPLTEEKSEKITNSKTKPMTPAPEKPGKKKNSTEPKKSRKGVWLLIAVLAVLVAWRLYDDYTAPDVSEISQECCDNFCSNYNLACVDLETDKVFCGISKQQAIDRGSYATEVYAVAVYQIDDFCALAKSDAEKKAAAEAEAAAAALDQTVVTEEPIGNITE